MTLLDEPSEIFHELNREIQVHIPGRSQPFPAKITKYWWNDYNQPKGGLGISGEHFIAAAALTNKKEGRAKGLPAFIS